MLFSRSKPPAEDAAEKSPRRGLFGRLRDALSRTRSVLAEGLGELFAGGRALDESLVEDLEAMLLCADVGVEATERIIGGLADGLKRRELANPEAVRARLRERMLAILEPVAQPLEIPAGGPRPFVVLVVGVNGTGKTTTIGKLAHRLKGDGHRVMLAAGDTFRAAAVEQLQSWGERQGVAVVAQHTGADSASVIYDALAAARAREMDVLVADTAGRLHTRAGLMDELAKVRRVMAKLEPSAPHETLLVLDGGTGQNALVQARQFREAVGVSGIAITKLDGTARGGIVFALAEQLGLPIRFIGVGEGIEDLRPFDAGEFVDALLGP